jgi:hypothetical protein
VPPAIWAVAMAVLLILAQSAVDGIHATWHAIAAIDGSLLP